MKFFAILVGALLLFLGAVTFNYYNTFPTLDEEVNAKWSLVQNSYKRRADLIPNLVSVVKGYAAHESSTLKEVIEARSKATSVNINPNDAASLQAFSNAQDGLTSALARLMVVVEKYPDLKANTNFLSLQNQLEGTENRISVARKDYVEAVQNYNLALRKMPGALVAKIFFSDMKPRENFKAKESEQEAPKIEF